VWSWEGASCLGGWVALSGKSEDVPDSSTGQGSLGNERPSRAGDDQFGEVLLVMGGDQDRRHRGTGSVPVKLFDDVKTALLAEIDIDERHVGPQVRDALQPFCGGGRHRYHADSLVLEQPCRRIEEIAIVVDNDATQLLAMSHRFSVEQQRTDRMEASEKFSRSREGLAGPLYADRKYGLVARLLGAGADRRPRYRLPGRRGLRLTGTLDGCQQCRRGPVHTQG
jgi:hypothetical protein